MFADMHDLPLSEKFYKDGDSYKTVEGGLTDGDGEVFLNDPVNLAKYPFLRNLNNGTVNGNETMSHWFKRYGDALERDIRLYKAERQEKKSKPLGGLNQ